MLPPNLDIVTITRKQRYQMQGLKIRAPHPSILAILPYFDIVTIIPQNGYQLKDTHFEG